MTRYRFTGRLTVAAAACLLAVAGCTSGGSSGSSSPPGQSGRQDQQNQPDADQTGDTGAAPDTTDPAPQYSGVISMAYQDGGDEPPTVDCTRLDLEVQLSPKSGTIQWTAVAQDSDTGFVNANRLDGVTVDPSSGLLGPGQSETLHVSGSAGTLPAFWIFASAPNAGGHDGGSLEFDCQGQ
ncbi:MAG TPA: hypothetical protein VGX23_08420 [Actinocrinis sp.]|nr:hypothetical protein [Actinocrinis sp.]